MKRGLDFLVSQQGSDGAVGPAVGEMMYNHAIATLALCDAYAFTGIETYKEPAQSAATFVAKAQNYGLGWRYTPRCGSNDTSVTHWCAAALETARVAGLDVPRAAFDGARTWANRVTETTGQAGYDRLGSGEIYVPGKNESHAHHPTMTACAMLVRLYADRRADAAAAKGTRLLLADLPKWDPKNERPPNDAYYWFHATNALFEVDGPAGGAWRTWNKAFADVLCQNQRVKKDRCADGSWDSDGVDRWAYAGGRVYTTAMNVLSLEVYYRHPRVLEEK